jgi:hypothetical protein
MCLGMNHPTTTRSLLALSLLSLGVACAGCYGAPDAPASSSEGITVTGPGPVELDPCIFQLPRPDLVLHAFSVSNVNGIARLNVTIRNRGCASSPAVAYVFQLRLVGGNNTIATWPPSSNAGSPTGTIPKGATQSFTFLTGYTPAQLAGFGGTWEIIVDPASVITELHEGNNLSTFSNPL